MQAGAFDRTNLNQCTDTYLSTPLWITPPTTHPNATELHILVDKLWITYNHFTMWEIIPDCEIYQQLRKT